MTEVLDALAALARHELGDAELDQPAAENLRAESETLRARCAPRPSRTPQDAAGRLARPGLEG